MNFTLKELKKEFSIIKLFTVKEFSILFHPFKKTHLQFQVTKKNKILKSFDNLEKTLLYLQDKNINTHSINAEYDIIIIKEIEDLVIEFHPFKSSEYCFQLFNRGAFLKSFSNIKECFYYINDLPDLKYQLNNKNI